MTGDSRLVSVNPIRDTLFASNPDLYYLIGNVLTIAASLILTGGMAANARRSKSHTGVIARHNNCFSFVTKEFFNPSFLIHCIVPFHCEMFFSLPHTDTG